MRRKKYTTCVASIACIVALFGNVIIRGRNSAQNETFNSELARAGIATKCLDLETPVPLETSIVAEEEPISTIEYETVDEYSIVQNTVYTSANILNVHISPSEESEIVYQAILNTQIIVAEDLESWIGFDYCGQRLYISSQYISYNQPELFETELYEFQEIKTTHINRIENEKYSAEQFKRSGVIRYNGWRFTYYSDKVLPGGGLSIPGRHYDENNYICDENDYICVASSTLSKGTVVDTPFGKQGKVYDCGCDSDVIDIYVHW